MSQEGSGGSGEPGGAEPHGRGCAHRRALRAPRSEPWVPPALLAPTPGLGHRPPQRWSWGGGKGHPRHLPYPARKSPADSPPARCLSLQFTVVCSRAGSGRTRAALAMARDTSSTTSWMRSSSGGRLTSP